MYMHMSVYMSLYMYILINTCTHTYMHACIHTYKFSILDEDAWGTTEKGSFQL